MEMKDKLVKNHHKGSYYRARKTLTGIGISLGLAVAVAIPTYISMHAVAQQKLNAQEQETVDDDSGEENNQYDSYTDAE